MIEKIPVLRELSREWQFAKFKKQWRRRNRHNNTVPCNIFPTEIVTVGNGTYGELHVHSYLPEAESLQIGNYVSIAPEVHFILGGNHRTDTLFPFPLKSRVLHAHCTEDAGSRGAVVVEDEAWIGYGATILSGVRIGKGAVVGARAVVTGDVPPYSIVAGNPARVVRRRLPEAVIEKVRGISLNDVPESEWKDLLDVFYTPLNENTDIDNLLKRINTNDRQ